MDILQINSKAYLLDLEHDWTVSVYACMDTNYKWSGEYVVYGPWDRIQCPNETVAFAVARRLAKGHTV